MASRGITVAFGSFGQPIGSLRPRRNNRGFLYVWKGSGQRDRKGVYKKMQKGARRMRMHYGMGYSGTKWRNLKRVHYLGAEGEETRIICAWPVASVWGWLYMTLKARKRSI